ncbi:hypothetical protein [Pseudomonas mediterranea]|uniref:hypothetical protein n=1 Tax=Pseudomonas mediterranea TaxID=183795 RepID=UPI0006D8B4EE|nr:hypothetical protein [Pseudomonas mediterranea]MDU9028700.1 hypothetical protein [Pseudomonas mediterranea]
MSVEKQWENLLTPAVMQERMIAISLYITAYEMLKESIIGRLKDFYCIGFDADGTTTSPDYDLKVLDLHKKRSPLYASLIWLTNIGAIDQEDNEVLEQLKALRNSLAHEMPEIILKGKDLALKEKMQDVMNLMRKVEVWWIVNVELETDPDYDRRDINSEEITPGPILMMQIMMEVLSGNEALKEHYKGTRSASSKP